MLNDLLSICRNNLYWTNRITIDIGIIHYNKGSYDLSLKYFLKVYSCEDTDSTSSLRTEALNYIGKYYHSKGDVQKSLKYYNKTLAMAKKNNDTLRIASAMNSLSIHYSTLGNLSIALEYGINSLKLQQNCSKSDKKILGATCNHLGNIYRKLQNSAKALLYHRMGLKYRSMINFREDIGKSYLNISKVYFEQLNYDSAQYYCLKANKIFEDVNYSKGKIKSYIELGNLAMIRDNDNQAHIFYEKSYQISKLIGYEKGEAKALISLGNLNYNQEEYNLALDYYKKSLKIAKALQIKDMLSNCYMGIQLCFENLNQFDKANMYAKLHYAIREELIKSEYNKQLATIQLLYETEQKQKENEILLFDNQLKSMKLKQKNLTILLSLTILIILSVITFIILYRLGQKHKAHKKLSSLNSELLKVNKEKDKLFSIIAHEIRNPLWWFKNITEMLSVQFDEMNKESLAETLKSLDESAKNTFLLMDNLLHWTRTQLHYNLYNPEKINLKEVILNNLNLFETMIKQKEIKLEVNVSSLPDVYADKEHLNIILRNLLSNSIKYTQTGGNIKIYGTSMQKNIILKIQDNGVGMEQFIVDNIFTDDFSYSSLGLMQEKGSGIGLKLCKEFVEKNGGSICLSSIPNEGTLIEFSIPKFKKKKFSSSMKNTDSVN
jgi:signal transduction histidine kinase